MRLLLAMTLLLALAACGGEPGAPGSITTHVNTRVNTYVGAASSSR